MSEIEIGQRKQFSRSSFIHKTKIYIKFFSLSSVFQGKVLPFGTNRYNFAYVLVPDLYSYFLIDLDNNLIKKITTVGNL